MNRNWLGLLMALGAPLALAVGCGGDDGMMTGTDSGMPGTDSGMPTDSGMMTDDDAGMMMDEDAGMTDTDAGMMDTDGGGGGASFAEVYAILSTRCMPCHIGGTSGGMMLGTTAESAYAALVGPDRATAGGCEGPTERVTPGSPEDSFMYRKVAGTHGGGACGGQMPQGGMLEAAQLETIRSWIAAGAPAP